MPTTTGARTMGKFDRNRKFGIEIEAYGVPRASLISAIRAAGVEVEDEGYHHDRRSYWKIVSDGSILGSNAFELVSPPLKGDAGLAEIEKVCSVLKSLNVQVNRSTGLHVHHDASDLNLDHIKSVLTMWWKYEDVLMYFLPPSRRSNFYCKPAMPTRLEGELVSGYRWTPGSDPVEGWRRGIEGIRSKEELARGEVFQTDRYAPVNCHALSRHGTLEFRAHAGTTEFSKIQAWIVLTQWFLTRAKERGCQIRTRMTGRWSEHTMFFWKAIDWINLDDPQVIKAKNTLSRRFKHFKEEGGAATRPSAALVRRTEDGRLRPTAAAGEQEPGER